MRLIVILLVSISFSAFSQDYFGVIKKPIQHSQKADSIASVVLSAFVVGGEDAMDKVLDSMDESWYAAMDMYITNDEEAIADLIEDDVDASFRLPQIKKATVSVAYNDFYTAVFIFSHKL